MKIKNVKIFNSFDIVKIRHCEKRFSVIKQSILCLIFFGLCLTVCHADEATESAPASQQLQGFNLNGYSNDGQKTWDVNGTKADISDQKIQITNVDANFYGKEQANLKADHG